MKPQPGVWMMQLKMVFFSAGEVMEEKEEEAGEGKLFFK